MPWSEASVWMANSRWSLGIYSLQASHRDVLNFSKFSRIRSVQLMVCLCAGTLLVRLSGSYLYFPASKSMSSAPSDAQFGIEMDYQLQIPRKLFICFGVRIISSDHSRTAATFPGAGERWLQSRCGQRSSPE